VLSIALLALKAAFFPASSPMCKECVAPFYFQNQPPYHNKENGDAETGPAQVERKGVSPHSL
jgi:hypothetical protein